MHGFGFVGVSVAQKTDCALCILLFYFEPSEQARHCIAALNTLLTPECRIGVGGWGNFRKRKGEIKHNFPYRDIVR